MNINYADENTVNNIQKVALQETKKIAIEEGIVYRGIKRITDILGAIIGIIVTIPLSLIVFIGNVITKDNGNIFYTQNRIGKNGKNFKMYKFRSMVIGADEVLQEYLDSNPDAKEEYRINKKLKDDPRVTKVGKFIRKTSIDEFPQFINVLKGEMSLVGPRPYLPREIGDMENYYPYIVDMKPGLTGLWQISGRSDVDFATRIDLDMQYYYNHSLKGDIKILFKTAMKLVKREGAL